MATRSLAALHLLALVASGCVGPSDGQRLRGVLPELGFSFGQMITVEGEFVPYASGKGIEGPLLRVSRSEGSAAYEGVVLDLMFRQALPPWSVDRDQHCGGMQPGVRYRLRGYESGSYRGEVEVPYRDEWGPRQVLPFHFQSWFVAVSFEPLTHSPRAGG